MQVNAATPTASNPADFVNRILVEYRFNKNNDPSKEWEWESKFFAGASAPFTDKLIADVEKYSRDRALKDSELKQYRDDHFTVDNMIKVVRGSFEDALAAASAVAKNHVKFPNGKSYNQDQAVIDAGNGKWFIASLSTKSLRPETASPTFPDLSWAVGLTDRLDSFKPFGSPIDSFEIGPTDPAVKALVGAKGWFDLRQGSSSMLIEA